MAKRRSLERHNYNLGDGAKVYYIPGYLENPNGLFAELASDVPWERMPYEVNGIEVLSPRLMHIIKMDKNAEDFPMFAKLRKRMEKLTGVRFKYAVLNYYRDGNDHIGFHSDREVDCNQIVASVSLGSTRRFVFKHRFRKDVVHKFMLGNGDVLVINTEAIKTSYKHAVPKMKNAGPRISITFRE